MKEITFISVSGFSASGSSAVVDLLKEFKDTYECTAEIRLIQDPYGIHQLERALIEDWNVITSSAAIRDFLWLCKMCGRNGGGSNPLAKAGLSYSSKINKDFIKISREYIEELSDYTFVSDYYYQKFKKPYPLYVYDRIALGIEHATKGTINIGRKKETSYFAHPTHERFNIATQNYFEKLYQDYIPQNGFVILDQAVSVNDPEAIHRYFKRGKLIIVDRDPRDMYVDDIVNWGSTEDSDYSSAEAGYKYALKHKAMHEKNCLGSDIYYVRFEDLVLHYNETVKRIIDFLGIKTSDHIAPKKYLIPEKSSKNVGIWKKHVAQFEEAINVIEKELSNYCFNRDI